MIGNYFMANRDVLIKNSATPSRVHPSILLLTGLWLFLGLFLGGTRLPAQIIDTIAGNISALDNRSARQTPLVVPRAAAADPTGTYLYIGDDGSGTVRRMHLATAVTTIVAGGGTAIDDLSSLPARTAALTSPVGLAVDGQGNVFIADDTHNRIRRLSPDGRITTIVGNGTFGYSGDGGPAIRAQLDLPTAVALDAVGHLYIADRGNRAIRRVDRITGIITTLAGGPNATVVGENISARSAQLNDPSALIVDPSGNVLFTDEGDNVVYRIEASSGLLRRVAGVRGSLGDSGDGGPAAAAILHHPRGLALAPNGDLYVGVLAKLRKISAATGTITTVLGGGAEFLGENRDGRAIKLSSNVEQIAISPAGSPAGDRLYFALSGDHLVGSLDLASNVFSILMGNLSAVGDQAPAETAAIAQPAKLAIDRSGNVYVADFAHHRIRKIAPGIGGPGTGLTTTIAGTGAVAFAISQGPATTTPIAFPRGLTLDSGGAVILSDSFRLIRRITPDGNLQIIAGTATQGYAGDNGPAIAAQLNQPSAVISDSAGNLYIADSGNHRIRRVGSNGIITTIAGTGSAGNSGDRGPATAALLNYPTDLVLDNQGRLFIADSGNNRVRVLFLATGTIAPAVNGITVVGMTMNEAGQLYMGGFNRLRRADFVTGTLITVAGDGAPGYSGDGGLATLARISLIDGLVVDASGNLLFSDTINNRLRRISSTQVIPALSVSPAVLNFTANQGGPAPPEQNVAIGSSNLAGTAWAATVQVLTGSGWLSIGSQSGGSQAGFTPALVPVSADSTGLAPGAYAGRITITAPGAKNSPTTISISLVVSGGIEPNLEVGPQQLSFRVIQGTNTPVSQTVLLSNQGGGTLVYNSSVTTSSGGNWLSVSPGSGTDAAIISITATPLSLPAGTYQGEVRFNNQSPGQQGRDSSTISVTMILDEPRPVLRLSQTGLVFTTSEASSFLLPESLGIINTGSGAMDWTAAVTPLSGGQWLSISRLTGSTQSGATTRITLSASPAFSGESLRAGVYDSLVTITATGAVNSPQIFLARLRVQSAGSGPVPILQPGGLVFTATAGDPRGRVAAINLASSGGAALNYVASARTDDGARWLSISSGIGTITSSADPTQVLVQASPGGLPAGNYTGRVAFSFDTGYTTEVVALLVVAPAIDSIRENVGAAQDSGAPRRAVCAPERQTPHITSITNNLQLPVGWPAGIRAVVVDNCGSPVTRSSVIATIATPRGAEYLTLQALGEGQYSANYNLESTGSYPIFVTATGSGLVAGRSETVVASTGASTGGGGSNLQTPVVNQNGGVSGVGSGNFRNLAPGQIFSVFGSNLAALPGGATSVPLPTQLAGVSVNLGGQAVPLYFSDSDHLNAQIPFETPVGSELPLVVIVNGKASPPESVMLARTSPGIFTVDGSEQGAGLITDSQGRPINNTNPARRGEVVIVYGTGFGATTPPVASGTNSPASPPAVTAIPVQAFVGGDPATVEFAGLAPGFVGLYQINLRIPADSPAGAEVELYLQQDSIASNKVTLRIE